MPPAARTAAEWTQENQRYQKVEAGSTPGTTRTRPMAFGANNLRMGRMIAKTGANHKFVLKRPCALPNVLREITTGLGGTSEPQTY
jgi:hypothetical protein